MPIFCDATAWEEYGKEYAVHKSLWRHCFLATLGPQPDKGTTARDYSGRNNHGTLTGATHLPTWGNQSYRGQSFRSVQTDGTDDWISYAWTLGTSNTYSVTGWCMTTSSSVGCLLYDNRISATARGSAIYLVKTTYYPTFYAYSPEKTIQDTSKAYNDGLWHFIGLSMTAGAAALYVDGSLIGSVTGVAGQASTDFRVEKVYDGGFRVGNVAGIMVHGRGLSPSEISILARHPLAAYEVRLPEYFTFTSTPSAGASPWLYDHGMVGGMTA